MPYTFDAGVAYTFDSGNWTFDSTTLTFDATKPWTFDSTRFPRFDYAGQVEQRTLGPTYGEGYWAPVYWNQAYYNSAYWADTHVTFGPTKVGGDDVPYRSRKNKGWNKKAWKKRNKLYLDIEQTLKGTLYGFDALGIQESFHVPPEIHIHVADEYERMLARLREIDDEEAMLLL